MKRLLISLVFAITPAVAYAQTRTLTSCAYDYMEHCSEYPISSAAARQCMLDVGMDLSPKCVNALVDDGFVTKQQVIDYAAKKGITVVDGPKGLVKVDKKPETVIAKDQTASPVEVIIPKKIEVVEDDEEVGKVTKEAVKKTYEKAKVTAKKVTESVKKTYIKAKTATKKAYTKAKTATKKAYTKTKTAAKKHVQKTTEYASRPNIRNQNKLRQNDVDNGFIVSEGVNADFGRYTPRPKGYSKKKFTYSWKKHMEDAKDGTIRSGGINAKF